MLHWNSWWSRATHDATGDRQSAPNQSAPWADDSLAGLQARFWDQWLDAHRSWWTMYAANLPTMPWPPAGVLAPPEPTEAPPARPATPRKKISATQRLRPVASGPAAAKLKQQRKR
jgi:hypothetical protein